MPTDSGKQRNYTMQMNMTPMIDVVFLLIIFFMIVTDLTQQELEELKLPKADMAEKDENPPERRVIVNIDGSGHYIVKRNDLGIVEDCVDRIRGQLVALAGFGSHDEDGSSKQTILIRADTSTEFEHVQKVMQICGEELIRIYKIELGCSLDKMSSSNDITLFQSGNDPRK